MSVSKLRKLPDPPRPLGVEGQRLWERVWNLRKPWIDAETDLDHVTLLCESFDERQALRHRVLQALARPPADNDWRDRVALRALEEQITSLMARLGLNPTDRKALNVNEEGEGGRLAELRAARAGRVGRT